MNIQEKLLVLGANGMVGSAIARCLKVKGYSNVLCPNRKELDLTRQNQTVDFFAEHKPDHVFLAAAKVGGIKANNTYPADFIFQNISIQTHVFEAAFKSQVKKLLFLGSSCIYPRNCPQPIKEEYLLTGPLEPTNEAYAVAKISGLKMAEFYRKQYGCRYFSVMPTNLYGPNDYYHPENSHVIPGLIHRLKTVMEHGEKTFEVWGTGTPRREFLHVDDLADACVFLMESDHDFTSHINIGTGKDITIRELAQLIMKAFHFEGQLTFNSQYPDGTPRKVLDISRIQSLGWAPKIPLEKGIQQVVEEFIKADQYRR